MGASIYNRGSILHKSGYSVNQKDNLSDIQRQIIIDKVLQNNLCSPAEVLNHLDWLILHNGVSKKKNMDVAVNRWNKDREYLIQHYFSKQFVKKECK